jgi:dCTP deaminase
MSILSGREIEAQYQAGRIRIAPFNPEHIGPNSYDLTLSTKLLTYVDYADQQVLLDPKKEQKVREKLIPEKGIVLWPGILYLGNTVEVAGSDHYVPMLEGRSSFGRLGLKVHVTAGFGDIGFKQQWTLELEVTHPVRVYAGMRVCQVYFHEIVGDVELYKGKYARSSGPEQSQAWRDFDN